MRTYSPAIIPSKNTIVRICTSQNNLNVSNNSVNNNSNSNNNNNNNTTSNRNRNSNHYVISDVTTITTPSDAKLLHIYQLTSTTNDVIRDSADGTGKMQRNYDVVTANFECATNVLK